MLCGGNNIASITRLSIGIGGIGIGGMFNKLLMSLLPRWIAQETDLPCG